MVAATLIAAPSSTKKARQQRDPERPQTKKGNQWPFGMQAHIGTDAPSGLVHTVSGTAAHVADLAQTHELLPGEEKHLHADAGYLGVDKRAEIVAQGKEAPWPVAAKRGKVQARAEGTSKELTQQLEQLKARCARGWSIPCTSLRTSAATARPATAAWPRTPPNSTASWPSLT